MFNKKEKKDNKKAKEVKETKEMSLNASKNPSYKLLPRSILLKQKENKKIKMMLAAGISIIAITAVTTIGLWTYKDIQENKKEYLEQKKANQLLESKQLKPYVDYHENFDKQKKELQKVAIHDIDTKKILESVYKNKSPETVFKSITPTLWESCSDKKAKVNASKSIGCIQLSGITTDQLKLNEFVEKLENVKTISKEKEINLFTGAKITDVTVIEQTENKPKNIEFKLVLNFGKGAYMDIANEKYKLLFEEKEKTTLKPIEEVRK